MQEIEGTKQQRPDLYEERVLTTPRHISAALPQTARDIATPIVAKKRLRVAIYSHDTFGLGHLRRNLLLANALKRWGPDADVLLITGSPRAFFFDAPDNMEIVKLPSVSKNAAGAYIPRHLDIPIGDVLCMRKGIIREAVLGFRPDIFLVDHAPIGLLGELLPLLGDLRHRSDCQLVLGLRDILDDPQRVISDWKLNGIYRVLDSLYQHIWVYGDQQVFSLGDLYQMPARIADRLIYLGYLGRDVGANRTPTSASRDFPDRSRPHILCLIGGGGDGHQVADSFIRMLAQFPTRWNGTLVTGPFLGRDFRNELMSLAVDLPHARILRFTTGIEELMASSDAIITMGGYNSMMETHSFAKRAIVVPRVFPRKEQWMRATAFEKLGLLKSLAPEHLTPGALAELSEHLLSSPAPPSPTDIGIAWDGARAFARRITALHEELQKNTEKDRHGQRLLRA